MIFDLFAGPGGLDEGLRMIGRTDVLGVEWDRAACDTAVAAGHARLWADVAAVDPAAVAAAYGPSEGLVGSPPCTSFSPAGKGTGRRVLDVLTSGISRTFAGDDVRDEVRAAIYPVALAERRQENARRRPDRQWTPERTEAAARVDASSAALVLEPARWTTVLDPGWVVLEQVPAVLPLWQLYVRELRARGYSAWAVVLNAADYGVPQTRERAVLGASRVRAVQPPEPTHAQHGHGGDLFGGPGRLRWVSMADALGWDAADGPSRTGVVRTGNFTARDHRGQRGVAYEREVTEPAPTLSGNAGRWFVSAGVTGEGRPKDAATQPADTLTGKGTAYWVHERPATTVQGDPCIEHERRDPVRVTVQEAGVLQSFPPDYPWQGTSGKQFQQVGNAVPPLLAAHVAAAVTGTNFTREVSA